MKPLFGTSIGVGKMPETSWDRCMSKRGWREKTSESQNSLQTLANKEDAAAQYNLVNQYEDKGGTQDHQEAIKRYRKAAEQGNYFARKEVERICKQTPEACK